MKMTIYIIGMILLRLAIIAAVVGIVMWLWNLIIPAITGWATINYWKALGLTVLFHLLTAMPMRPHSGMGSHGHSSCFGQKITRSERAEMRSTMFQLREKVSKMSSEERRAFLKRIIDAEKEG